jgi:ceramide glucosyltransferase
MPKRRISAKPRAMSAAPFHLAGERLLLDPAGVLVWPARKLMAVADLHFEKGSAFAERGRFVPPYDTRETLARIGGFAAFGDVLADDYEMGAAVRALGLSTVLPPFYITHGCSESSLAALVRHEMRWTVTIFRIDPAGFAGSIVVHTLPIALIGAALGGFSAVGLAVLGGAFASRALVKLRMDRVSGSVSGPLWLVPFRDLVSFALFCATFFVHKVDWRGSQFRVTRDGRLQS